MRKYGLIGRHLGHSFSPEYFKNKFESLGLNDIEYKAYPLEDIAEILPLLQQGMDGYNVTIPYKETVIQYLTSIDEAASEIGAVNCIKKTTKGYMGFNTDWIGFRQSLESFIVPDKPLKALVLGYGGAAKGVCYALARMSIPYKIISRQDGYLIYKDLSEQHYEDHHLIINTTSLGMYPNIDTKPELNYACLMPHHYLYDIVYNPTLTAFLKEGHSRGSKIKNGYDMLIFQAEESWKIWNDDKY